MSEVNDLIEELHAEADAIGIGSGAPTARLLRQASVEVERLRVWKDEATYVISGWEEVWEALGQPGALGSVKSQETLHEIVRLREALEEIREMHTPAGDDGETYCPWCDTFGDPCKNYEIAVAALGAASDGEAET